VGAPISAVIAIDLTTALRRPPETLMIL
jgi:hypothetical protein